MMPSPKTYLTAYTKIFKFAIVNDESSDTGLEKMNAVCTHIFYVERPNKVQVKFFNIFTTSDEHCSTAESLFNAIDNAFTSYKIFCEQYVSIGVDNVNIGVKSSLKSRVQERNKSCFIAGYNCLLAHIAANDEGSSYSRVSGFDMEDHMVDLYYYFKSSSNFSI